MPLCFTNWIQCTVSLPIHLLDALVHTRRREPGVHYFQRMTDDIVLLRKRPEAGKDSVVDVLQQEHSVERVNHVGLPLWIHLSI